MNKLSLRKAITDTVRFKAQTMTDGELALEVYDVIGGDFFGEGVTAASISNAIKAAGDFKSIACHINSPGGDVFEGVAIYNILKSCGKPVNVLVDGLAASAASIVAMAGDTVTMGEGSMMMIHNAMGMAFGYSAEMRKLADVLDTCSDSIAAIYASNTKQSKTACRELMDAETWMDAQEAVKRGFANSVSTGKVKVRAEWDLSVYNHVPEKLMAEEKPELVPEPEPEAEDVLIPILRKRLELLRRR